MNNETAPPSALKLLIVEDDRDTRENLRDILELNNHFVTIAENATEALKTTQSDRSIDVIILDRKLPEGLAETFLPQFRERFPNSDIVFVTGYADLEGTISAMREGVSDYIIKPVNPSELLANLQRIGQRKRIERELSEERQFAQMILKTAEAIVLVLDPAGKIARFNPYLPALTGYNHDDLTGKDWFETFIPPEDQKRIKQLFHEIFRDVESRGVMNPIITKSGELREIRWSNTPLKNDLGESTGVLAVGLDVTDLVKAQESVLQSARLATIGQTMTGLAHESRNALQRLQNALELLEDDLQDNPSALRDLEKIGRASNDLRDLLEEVRNYAAPIHLDCEKCTLPGIWRRAWANLEDKRSRRSVELSEEVSFEEETEFSIDRKRLERVFRNLFENAMDACEDPVRICVSADLLENSVVIVVADNGPGMSFHQSKRAFDAFFTTKSTGTGLGLAIVHRIIEAHGGSIDISSTDEGATFSITFPR